MDLLLVNESESGELCLNQLGCLLKVRNTKTHKNPYTLTARKYAKKND
jgi:hypothetical protein